MVNTLDRSTGEPLCEGASMREFLCNAPKDARGRPDLRGADFRRVVFADFDFYFNSRGSGPLQEADFTGAIFPKEIPTIKDLDARILYVLETAAGILDMGDWHDPDCNTTHCLAGWAIYLAGEDGKKLEDRYGPEAAGGLIYAASTGRVPNFYTSNRAALEALKERASTSEQNTQ